jgi:sporulation protein YlmC with PRC-barrel domain
MGAMMNTLPAAALLSMLTLAGCSGLSTTVHPPPASAATPPAPVAGPPVPPPTEPIPSAGSASNPAPPAAEAPAAAPPCTCLEATAVVKPRTKRRHKRKPEHRETATTQLQTAPAVAQIPPGGTVNAEVKAMSVPVMSILGKRVKGAKGEDLGRVVDVLADANGRVRIAIVDFGGFLGVGNHRIAVDWPLLRFNPDGEDPSLLLSLSPEKLRTAPEYKDNPRPQTLMEPPPPEPDAAVPPAVKK